MRRDPAGGFTRRPISWPTLLQNMVDGPLRDDVRGSLLFAQDRFEVAHQIGRAHDLLIQAAQKLDRPRVDHRDVHDGVVRRVLHGDGGRPTQHGLKAGREFEPAGVESFAAGQRIEPRLFYAMPCLGMTSLS